MYRNKSASVLLRKAEDKLKGASTALEQGRYDDCVSDSYYSCFQSVLSLMTIRGDASKKHQHTEFVGKLRLLVEEELGKRDIKS